MTPIRSRASRHSPPLCGTDRAFTRLRKFHVVELARGQCCARLGQSALKAPWSLAVARRSFTGRSAPARPLPVHRPLRGACGSVCGSWGNGERRLVVLLWGPLWHIMMPVDALRPFHGLFLESIFIDQAALNGTRPNSPSGVKPARPPFHGHLVVQVLRLGSMGRCRRQHG